MLPLVNVLGPWHEFYSLLGTASATMVGLLFVAATVSAGVFSSDRRAPLRLFLSASVVNFGLLLAACLVGLAPLHSWLAPGLLILGCAVFGLAHSGLAWRDSLHDGLIRSIDLEDRIWYLVLPIAGYALVAVSGVALALQFDVGCLALAVSMGMLLGVGLHNAWDITVWSITQRRRMKRRQDEGSSP